MVRFCPKGLSIIIPLITICVFILCIFVISGTLIIIDNKGLTEKIIGAGLIVLALIVDAVFSYWLMYEFRIEISSTKIVQYDYSIPPGWFFGKEISLCDLKKLKIDNGIYYNFIYQDGSRNIINLKSFSKKQRVKIELEILKNACKVNGVAVEVL